jgi:hypothetical protein
MGAGHGVYPGAPISPVKTLLCTKANVKISKVKKGPLGSTKFREEVCCCQGSGRLVELANTQGSVMAAWGKKDDSGAVTPDKAEETKTTEKPIELPQ